MLATTVPATQADRAASGIDASTSALDDVRQTSRRRCRRSTSSGAIAAYLDEQTAKIDTLIAETERFIELARERRSALITAAVTGQIDVREMA